jgi:hypothetical protein
MHGKAGRLAFWTCAPLALLACSGQIAIGGAEPADAGPAGRANVGSGTSGAGGQSSSGAGGASGVAGTGTAAGGRDSGPASSPGASAGSSGSSPGPSGGVGPAAAEGGTRPGRGCGLGTSCIPGNDLTAPGPTEGFQIVTPPGMFTVDPGQETFSNYCAVLPGTAEFDVGKMQSWMSPGSSHELIVYQQPAGEACGQPANPANAWIFAASIPGTIVELKMPDGVGVPLLPGTQILLNMHFINTSTTSTQPQVKVNLFGISNFRYKAGSMVSFNTGISIPAGTAAGPGTQTVAGTCTAPAGASFFAMGTHTNAHATVADVNFSSGGTTTNIVHTTDWQNPDVGVWLAPPFLAVGAGDQFTYSCAYANDGPSPVTVGETQANNEMCMAVGYYFPAGTVACN